MMAAPPDPSAIAGPAVSGVAVTSGFAADRGPAADVFQPGPPRWHLRVDGRESGPVTWEVLGKLARRGDLKPTDAVRRTDEDQWVPAAAARYPAEARHPAETRNSRQADRPPVQADPVAVAADGRASPIDGAPAAAGVPCRPVDPPAGSPLLALGLGLAGLIVYALPLGLLSTYLGGRAAALLARGGGGHGGRPIHLAVAVTAVAVGVADVGVSL
jgi:hypothetical protein